MNISYHNRKEMAWVAHTMDDKGWSFRSMEGACEKHKRYVKEGGM